MPLYTSNISALLSAGADAMDNLFEVSFHLPSSWGITEKQLEQLTLRAENFTPPAPRRSVVNVPYQTIVIQKAGSAVELQKQITLTIRLDAGFSTYNALARIRDVSYTGSPPVCVGSSNDKEEMRISVITYQDDASGMPGQESVAAHRWDFHNAILVNLVITEYSHDNQAAPVKATVDFIYSTYTES